MDFSYGVDLVKELYASEILQAKDGVNTSLARCMNFKFCKLLSTPHVNCCFNTPADNHEQIRGTNCTVRKMGFLSVIYDHGLV